MVRFAHTADGGQSWTDYDVAQYRATTCRVNRRALRDMGISTIIPEPNAQIANRIAANFQATLDLVKTLDWLGAIPDHQDPQDRT